jgi:hypothetical protein
MIVTDAMVTTALNRLRRQFPGLVSADAPVIRKALEDALRDIPDVNDLRMEVMGLPVALGTMGTMGYVKRADVLALFTPASENPPRCKHRGCGKEITRLFSSGDWVHVDTGSEFCNMNVAEPDGVA